MDLLKQGFLRKSGSDGKGVRKRFFVLTPSSLIYYANQGDKKPKGKIAMKDVHNVTTGDKPGEIFLTVPTINRTYHLFADTEEIRQEWMRALNKALSRQKSESDAKVQIDSPSTFNAKKPSGGYDMILKISTLKQIIDEEGWEVEFGSPLEREKWDGHIIGVMGLFNKGKTFCLNRLCNTMLNSGDTERDKTVGLSIKFLTTEDTRKHVILDSAGLHRPIEVKTTNQDVKISDALFTMEITEEFLNATIVTLADYIILMVDHLNILDQKFLQQLMRQRSQTQREFKEIFVVHNIRTLTSLDEYEALWKGICCLYEGVEVIQPVRLKGDPKEYNVRYFQSEFARHVMLGNDDPRYFGRTHNERTFELLRYWVQSIVPRRVSTVKGDILEPVVAAMNNILPNYLDGFHRLYFHKDMCKILHEHKCEEAHVVKPTFKPEMVVRHTGYLTSKLDIFHPVKRVFTTDVHWVIELEVPGMTEKDLTVRPAQSEVPDHWGVVIEGTKPPPTRALFVMEQRDSSASHAPNQPTTIGKEIQNSRQHGRFSEHFDIPNSYKKERPIVASRDGIVQFAWKLHKDMDWSKSA